MRSPHCYQPQKKKNNMKTTALGILTIVATLSNVGIQLLNGGAPDLVGAFAAVTAGFGLIKARDAGK